MEREESENPSEVRTCLALSLTRFVVAKAPELELALALVPALVLDRALVLARVQTRQCSELDYAGDVAQELSAEEALEPEHFQSDCRLNPLDAIETQRVQVDWHRSLEADRDEWEEEYDRPDPGGYRPPMYELA